MNPSGVPVLLVHGIWDSATRLDPLRTGLQTRGIADVESIDLVPNDGRAPIAVLGARVAKAAAELRRKHGCERIDLVGFSMGALVTRWFIQRGGGRSTVRRFISISGPHGGTLTAYALPFAGVRDMRPASDLLRDLAADADPWGSVEVHCLYTPFDLMIVPAKSAVLPNARAVHRFTVPMHRFMITNARVLDSVAAILRSPTLRDPSSPSA